MRWNLDSKSMVELHALAWALERFGGFRARMRARLADDPVIGPRIRATVRFFEGIADR